MNERELLDALRGKDGIPFAVLGDDGTLAVVSHAFAALTGASAGSAAPAWLASDPAAGQEVELGGRIYDLWTTRLGDARVVGLRDRSELIRLEDQIWEQQARLTKVYAELSVRNQVLAAALEKLRQHEVELKATNEGLEHKVQEQLGLLERSNRLMRYLSPEIANSIIKRSDADLAPQKRLLTVLYADLASFDELVAEMESEEVIEILNDYRRETTAVIFDNGGTLDKFLTVRIMAFFGDPVPQEDHAARAVRTGLQMRARVQDLRRKWFPSATHVDLQVGIHTGYATVGNVGSEHRVDYTVIGKNVTMAASLQQEAAAGQVLLTSRTYEAVKDLFECEGLQVVLKGSSRPIGVYNARSEKVSRASVPEPDKTLVLEGEGPASPGKRLAHYSIVEKLGQGGMGTVYKATDERLQRIVAVKVLSAELSADAKFVSRFKREGRALASLNSPYIAQIYFISDKEFPPFFAMEFVDGPTLRKVLADQGRFPLRRALELVTQIARGLQVAAEKGIVHRDVKPENVMLTHKGHVKLTDFGLSKTGSRDPGLTTKGIVMGTPFYMSPEQARGEEVDLRSDIYSLGATFFHVLVGRPPFPGDSALAVLRKHDEEDLPPIGTLPPSISPGVYEVLRRMMAKRRDDRFPNYESLLEALDGC